jgi:hypothetical protein
MKYCLTVFSLLIVAVLIFTSATFSQICRLINLDSWRGTSINDSDEIVVVDCDPYSNFSV